MVNYCVIPLGLESLLEQHVQAFEEQNPHLKAIVVGVYVPTIEEGENTLHMLGRIYKYTRLFEKVWEIKYFLLVADDTDLPEEIRSLMLQNGVQIMTNEEYITFYQSLQ